MSERPEDIEGYVVLQNMGNGKYSHPHFHESAKSIPSQYLTKQGRQRYTIFHATATIGERIEYADETKARIKSEADARIAALEAENAELKRRLNL